MCTHDKAAQNKGLARVGLSKHVGGDVDGREGTASTRESSSTLEEFGLGRWTTVVRSRKKCT